MSRAVQDCDRRERGWHDNPRTGAVSEPRQGQKWRARYVDDQGNEHAKGFDRKTDAQAWLNAQMSTLVQGTQYRHGMQNDHARVVRSLDSGYAVHRDSTVRQAKVHIS
ncbi:hypothetical protein [Nocardia australiensis]|uniref:hypothetical protein n=1 Tax=Nocardia australiensis TaxID=2887191 RepID=UPI001D144778|nr:hypothetical protein [Nocardia australiensis]